MTVETIYYSAIAPRSIWYPTFIKKTGLDIDAVESHKIYFKENFPLKKIPAFLRSDGFKLTETVAIIPYLNSLIANNKHMGITKDKKAQVFLDSFENYQTIESLIFGNMR